MSHNLLKYRFFKFVILSSLLFINSIITPVVASAAPLPNCGVVISWGARVYELDKDVKSLNYWGGMYQGYKYNGKYLLSGFLDENFKPAFGVTFGQWKNDDIDKFFKLIKTCYLTSKVAAKAAYKKRKYKLIGFFNGATGYLGLLGAMTPVNQIDSYASIMAHQKKLYKEYSKARKIMQSQLKEAKSMRATSDNIKQLFIMARNPQFVYLRAKEKKNHEIVLQNHRVRLADKIVIDAAKKFNSFAETLDGLTKIQAYRQQLQKDLQTLQSSKWKEFEQAYKKRTFAIAKKSGDKAIAELKKFPATYRGLKNLNAYQRKLQRGLGQIRSNAWPAFLGAYSKTIRSNALIAIKDFKKEMDDLPATAANMRVVQTTVQDLFKLRNPSNMKAYQDIAKERGRVMKQEIRKIACYKKLDSVGLENKARDVPLLGPRGETTLGLFVCGLNKRGNKFQEYKSAGIFSSTYTLTILNRRGITLTVEMKKVEAVKGKKMLVGVLVKDATSETKLSLDGWQDYAARLSAL